MRGVPLRFQGGDGRRRATGSRDLIDSGLEACKYDRPGFVPRPAQSRWRVTNYLGAARQRNPFQLALGEVSKGAAVRRPKNTDGLIGVRNFARFGRIER